MRFKHLLVGTAPLSIRFATGLVIPFLAALPEGVNMRAEGVVSAYRDVSGFNEEFQIEVWGNIYAFDGCVGSG